MASEFKEELARTIKHRLAHRDDNERYLDPPGFQIFTNAERKAMYDADIKHLERWMEDGDNPIWEAFLGFNDIVFIERVLEQRRIAEAAKDGNDLVRTETEITNKKLNELAEAAEALGAFYRDPNSIMPWESKWSSELPLIPLKRLIRVLEREAVLLRASAPPVAGIDISRQGKTKKKRGSRSRGELTFMREVSAMVVGKTNRNHIRRNSQTLRSIWTM